MTPRIPSAPEAIDAVGRIDSVHGGIRSTFETVPDQPLSKVVLTMKGGQKGLIQNSRDICAHTYRAALNLRAHNAKSLESQPPMKAAGCGGKKHKAHHRRHHR